MSNAQGTSYNSKAVRLCEQVQDDLQKGRFPTGQLLPTEFELAEQYAVSRSTVRRVLAWLVADGHLLKEPQRGVMVPDSRNGHHQQQVAWVTTGHSENVMEYGRGLQNALDPDRYTLATYCSHADLPLYHKLIDQVVAMRPVGIVLQGEGLHLGRRPVHNPRALMKSGIPTVVIGGDDHLELSCDRVFASRFYAARKTAEYAVSQGARELALVTLLPPNLAKPMIAELRSTLAAAGRQLPEERVFRFEAPRGWSQPPDPYIDAQEQMARLLAGGFRCDTILVDHDYPAVGVLRALLAAGIRVPGETRVISFQKCQVASASPMRLTTFDHHRYDIGYAVGEILRRRLDGHTGTPEVHRILAADLVAGETG